MVSEKVYVNAGSGLHLRPAGLLCKKAMEYECSIRIMTKTAAVNAKSVLSVLGACIGKGDQIEIVCDGNREAEALAAIRKLIEEMDDQT